MQDSTIVPATTIGLDVSDRWTQLCVVDGSGEIVEEAQVRTTEPSVEGRFTGIPRVHAWCWRSVRTPPG